MQAKANGKQTLAVLLIALILVTLCIGGLWIYVKNADAEMGVQEVILTETPEVEDVNITREKYDNYPIVYYGNTYWHNGKPLSENEIQRLDELTKAYAEGLRPEENAPSLPEEYDFAIIPLDPVEFAGMTEYYLLPESSLTDQELLMLIAYGEKRGLPFTDDTLTVNNCMRGFNTHSNRYLSAGETARRNILLNRCMMGGLRPGPSEVTHQKLPVTGVGNIRLSFGISRVLDTFHLYPIRELTDDELLQSLYLYYIEGYTYLDPAQEKDLDPAGDEGKMRSLLEDMMSMPISAENTCLSYKRENATGDIHLHANFKTALINGKETEYVVIAQRSSGNILYILQLTSNLANPFPSENAEPPLPDVNVNEHRWADIATKAVSMLTSGKIVSATASIIAAMGDDREPVVKVDVSMEDGEAYHVQVRVRDGMFMTAQYMPGDVNSINRNVW